MKPSDIGVADGHALVRCNLNNYASRPLLWPFGTGNWDESIELFQQPDAFRVIPDAMIQEHNELLERQAKERDAFAQRVADMPKVHIDIAVR